MSDVMEYLDKIGAAIVDAAFKIHKELGPGLLESIYEACLVHELTKRGMKVRRQVPVSIEYDGLKLDAALKIDILVEESVIVELKAVEKMIPLFDAQLLTYMKLTRIRLGYLINFNSVLIKNGIKRMVL